MNRCGLALLLLIGSTVPALATSITLTGTVRDFIHSLRLTAKTSHDMDLSFAERHTTQSNFRVDTTVPLTQPVAEPGSMLLLGSGLTGVAGIIRRRSAP